MSSSEGRQVVQPHDAGLATETFRSVSGTKLPVSVSPNYAIKVQGLSKCYQLYPTPRDRLKQFVIPRLSRLFFKKPRNYFRELWAVRDVSFTIRQGETVGIVGKNGSGKSTVLQMICDTLTPTSGTCEAVGSIAALLELGSGFNPEFSGRENIYLYGQILGISEENVTKLLPEIEAFAELGSFIDQPVKTYSSGMLVRLAFSVSISRSPDILVVDEALAVGDEAFRRKCFSKIETLRKQGTTVLFVSHASSLVVELCDRALLLDGGELLFDGAPKETIALYNKLLFAAEGSRGKLRQEILDDNNRAHTSNTEKLASAGGESTLKERPQYIPGLVSKSRMEYEEQGAVVLDPHIETLGGDRVNCLIAMQQYQYCYQVRFSDNARNVQFGMLMKTVAGTEIGGAIYPGVNDYLEEVASGDQYDVRFTFRCLFNPGTYFANAGLMGETSFLPERTYLHRILDAVMFKVQPYEGRITNAVVNFDVSAAATGTTRS